MNTVSRKSFLTALVATVVAAASRASAQQPATTDAAIGSIATVKGASHVIRSNRQFGLRAGNEIFRNDVLQTGHDGALGVAFDDETSLALSANTRVTVNNFIYRDGAAGNTGFLNVARGTLTFFAGRVAKTGEMKIATPMASLGIRGTTGVINVPTGAGGAPSEARIKLYPDQDGTVGRIEIFGNDGAPLGSLSQGSTGLAVRLDAAATRSLGQPRFAVTPIQIAPIELTRDRAELRQLASVRTLGRQIIDIRRRGGAVPPTPRP
jgi:hypothetical protein